MNSVQHSHREHKGKYHDAIFNKGNVVVLALFEHTGAACPSFAAHARYLGRQAESAGGRDATKYGTTHRCAKKFYTHWMQRCARVATLALAQHMLDEVGALKARATRLAAPSVGRP